MAGDEATIPKPSIYLQDMDEMRKVFNRFDANSDGKISADELAGVLEALGSATSADEVARMMQLIDTDEDGHINLEEFTDFCKSDAVSDGASEKELREAFELYDRDRDGKISAAELHQILIRIGERCSESDCAVMIKSVDSDGNGFVGFEEFRKMMSSSKSTAA